MILNIRYDIASAQSLGTREDQQDSFCWEYTENGFIAVLCDGMGGMELGAEASETAVEAVLRLLRSRPFSTAPAETLLDAMDIADEAVFRLNAQGEKKIRSGTTIVTALAQDDLLYWLSVGDSRMFIVRAGQVIRATRDHNYYMLLDDLLRSGDISAEEYRTRSEKGHALISYIGMRGIRYYDVSETPLPLLPEDILILASDGLYVGVTDEDILLLCSSNGSAQELADSLLQCSAVKSGGSQDNATIITIICKG